MAVLLPGPMIADARGSIGGTTYARNAAGLYARNRVKPVYPATDKQTTQAQRLSTIVDRWRSIATADEREAWNDLARKTTTTNALGQPMRPSGMQLYVKSNLALLSTAQAVVETAPDQAIAPSPTLTLAHTVGQGIQVTDAGTTDTTVSGTIAFWWQGPRNLTQYFHKGPYANYDSCGIAALAAVPVLIVPNAELVISRRYAFRIRQVNADGAVSASGYTYVDTPGAL